jgi:hypothetical protein
MIDFIFYKYLVLNRTINKNRIGINRLCPDRDKIFLEHSAAILFKSPIGTKYHALFWKDRELKLLSDYSKQFILTTFN